MSLDAPDDDPCLGFVTAPIDPGDEFTMTAAQLTLMGAVPRDGSELTFECDECGVAGATEVKGEQKWTGGTYKSGVRWEGNQIWFRYCSGYCDDEFWDYYTQEHQFIILLPNDTGNDGS